MTYHFPKSILFDMDGVILDSMPSHVKAWQEALSDHGLSVSEKLLYLHEGAIEPETAVAIFEDNGCPMTEKRFHEILARQKAIFRKRFQPEIRPFPEIPALLERLHGAGLHLALVTSSHREILDMVLPVEIRKSMSFIVTGDQVKRRKPFPDPYLAALEGLELEKEECVVVENAPAGIQAAKAAELYCVALATTLREKYLAEADAVLASHRELSRYLFESDR